MEEHVRFLKGMQVFGRNWPLVTYVVGTRPRPQVAAHAQAFFKRSKKEDALKPRRSIMDVTVKMMM